MPGRRRCSRLPRPQQPRSVSSEQQQDDGQHNHQEPRQRQQRPMRRASLKDAAPVCPVPLSDEVQRRLRLSNAYALEVASARMHGGDMESPPSLIRVSASQTILDRKRYIRLAWTPAAQQPPTSVVLETPSNLEFTSPSGQYVAHLTARPEEDKSSCGGAASDAPPAQRLEVWGAEGSGSIGCCFCLTAPHGGAWSSPYGGGSFCACDENLFAYTAEAASQDSKHCLNGNLYKDLWGEQLPNHSRGRVYVGRVFPPFLKCIEPRDCEASYCQASFIPDGSALVCTELPAGPYRLGLKFCINRPASVVLAWFPLETVPWKLIGRDAPRGRNVEPLFPAWLSISGDEDWAAWGARIYGISEVDGPLLRFEVVYLALSDDPKETRPHFGNVRLRLASVVRATPEAPWKVESRRTVLGPSAPWDPRRRLQPCETPNGDKALPVLRPRCVAGPMRETGFANDERRFAGLSTLELPQWTSPGFILANTPVGCMQTVFAIRLDGPAEGPIVRQVELEKPQGPSVPADFKAAAAAAAAGGMLLRHTWGPWLLIQTSSPVHVPILVLAKLRSTSLLEGCSTESDIVGPPLKAEIIDVLSLRGPYNAFDGAVKKLHLHLLTLSLYSLDSQRHWLVRLARSPKGPDVPKLAVLIHGGPHACTGCMYSREVLFLTTLGFDVLAVNYRGSTGFGQEELVSLHGCAGRQDVDDVAGVVQQVITHFGYDPRRCVAVGGSHGGFLCCHLAGQYPKLFCAVSMRNPVTYVPAMYAASDIPDFVFPESCRESFAYRKMPSKESLVKMQHLSPTEYVGAVEAPVLLAVGAKDLRVPPSQGLLYWKLLNAHGKKNRLLWYPNDNHSLDRPATDADYWANTGAWFLAHVPEDSLPPI
ncbi:hypothetical protein Efla_003164 [Eimeria flavescens]